MTHPWGSSWNQPRKENILIDDTHAIMDKKSLDELNEYSCSQPSGVYDGKMWKSKHGNEWFLKWFCPSSRGKDFCSTEIREILICDNII